MMETPRTISLAHVTTVSRSFGFLAGQIEYVTARGFQVHAVSSPGDFAKHLGDNRVVEVHTVPMSRSITPLEDIVALWRLWRLFRRIRPEIVHSHTPKAGLLGTLAARAAGVKVVFLSVFGLVQMTRTGPVRRLLDTMTRLACFAAHRVWCDSFSVAEYLVESGLCPSEKTVVFGHGSVRGVDALHKFSPQVHGRAARHAVRARYGIPDNALVLGYAGRIVGDKGMHELARAWHALREKYSDLHLLMLGQSEAKDMLLRDDDETFRTDERVHLAGQRTDVAPHMAGMDLFVMPSYREGFGIANIEAAAMELPVVSTRIPGCIDSVIDGVTGTLVPPYDAEALIQTIRVYLDEPRLRRKHGQAGRERVLRDFRPEGIWEAIHQEYLRLLHVKGPSCPETTSIGEEDRSPHY